MKRIFLIVILSVSSVCAFAQNFIMAGAKDERTEPMKAEMSEFYAPVPPAITPGDIVTNSAPSDAIVLFDGKNLDAWETARRGTVVPAGWIVNGDGTMTVDKRTGDIRTKESFGDIQLHVEWMVPENITGSGQARGNSGIIIQGKYEVQVLDSYQNETYVNGQVGSIYKQATPLANPMRKPGEWNVYDIIYTAPTFKADGTYHTYPYITVILNGVLVQNHTMIVGTTEYIGFPKVGAHGDGPIVLQAHGDKSEPLSFRNIWVRKL